MLHGKSSSVKIKSVSKWKDTTVKKLFNIYNEEDIFNAVKGVFFCKLLAERSLVFKGKTCSRAKQS